MGTDVEIMSERASMERMYNDISEIRREQSEMKSDISEIKNDIVWIKDIVEKVNNHFESCKVCTHSDEIVDSHNKLKKVVFEIRDQLNQIKWTSAGISAGISLIIVIIAFIYKLKST